MEMNEGKKFKAAFWCGNELRRDSEASDLKFSHACGFSSAKVCFK